MPLIKTHTILASRSKISMSGLKKVGNLKKRYLTVYKVRKRAQISVTFSVAWLTMNSK